MQLFIIVVAVIVILFFLFSKGCSSEGYAIREGYRDPLYMNRASYVYDLYPRANGSIYGLTYSQGGSWSVASGYPYYDRVY